MNRGFHSIGFYLTNFIKYEESLQFPADVYEELGSNHLGGDDRYGDYRPTDVEYQPMDFINATFDGADEGVYFWVAEDNGYKTYSAVDGWTDVSESVVQKVKDDKAYIYNPPNESLTFLSPRDIFMGIKLSYNF